MVLKNNPPNIVSCYYITFSISKFSGYYGTPTGESRINYFTN
jgi:hypothetical protein